MEKMIKRILLFVLVAVLAIPLLQYQTSYIDVKKLNGSYKEIALPSFTINNWFTSSFQIKYDKYFNDHFGFRNDLVRIHNQIQFSFFKEATAKYVVVGKNDYLFEKQYISTYYGQDFVGIDSIYSTVEKIKKVYKNIQKHQTELLVVIAPGKGYYYSENIPENLKSSFDTTNYDIYIKALKEHNIPFIDFNSLFLSMKDTSSIVLYPKTGIHWSQGAIPYVTDTILRRIESLINKKLKKAVWEPSLPVVTVDKQDSDLEKGMNLLFPIDKPKMSYPKITFEGSDSIYKPKLISVGDSFWWQIFNLGISKTVFDNGKFWYYYKQVYPDNFKGNLYVRNVDALDELQKADIVILMATPSNLFKFPYGFENALNPKSISDSLFQVKVKNLATYIKADEKWMKSIRKKAGKQNISIDSMIVLDASFMIKKKYK